MKVKLYRKDTVLEFAENHANARIHCDNFISAIEYADWAAPLDITQTVRGNLLGNASNRVVFDLGGNGRNAFRVICKYVFRPYKKLVYLYVLWIDSHEEYNKLTNQQKLTVWNY
jgi:mRNA-degrading endonuclease HigB of HigAB toxin-antitoxin module